MEQSIQDKFRKKAEKARIDADERSAEACRADARIGEIDGELAATGLKFFKAALLEDGAREAEFKKRERSVKKYNMFAFKKLIFDFYPEMKDGNFIGKKVSEDKEKNTVSYELTLPTDDLFVKVHGEIVLHYDVYTNKNIILLKTINPEELFLEGHSTELGAYKGVMISKENAQKDMFKINLLDLLNK